MPEARPPEQDTERISSDLYKHSLVLPDGRPLYLYLDSDALLPPVPRTGLRPAPNPHLRYDPLRGDWVMVAAERQDRTFKPPAETCPLCPTREGRPPTEIPFPDFSVAVFENRFPSLAPSTAPPAGRTPSLAAPSAGTCEVIVYSPLHEQSTSTLGPRKLADVVRVWRERTLSLGRRNDVRYLLIFENRGEDVGVTLHHPHGQIYAYPFVPAFPERERAQVAAAGDLLGDLLAFDLQHRERLMFEDESWVTLVPFWARYPFELYVLPRRMHPNLASLSADEQTALGATLDRVVKAYDRLFDRPMPYVMAVQQAPLNAEGWQNYRMRVEFQPRLRAPGKLKYLAGTETAAGAFAVDALAEEYAARLRDAVGRAAP
ncbi:MAG TPA: galactose-1-phosphate uridylyltransferase [Trueperaceae bacterium]